MNRLLIILCIAISFFSCDPHDGRLILENNTKDTLFYIFSRNDSIYGTFPLKFDKLEKIDPNYSYVLYPDSFHRNFIPNTNGWEDYINNECEGGELRIFLFDRDLLINNEWETIKKKRMYKVKLKTTVKYLQNRNWTLRID